MFDHVMISVQRHVGTYSLMVNDENRMQLRQASPSLRADRSLGVQIALAPDIPTTTLQVEQIFDLAQASSANPVVFAPVELAYYRAGDLDSIGVCPRSREHTHTCTSPTRARFVDGGAFDNRPISIADRRSQRPRGTWRYASNASLRLTPASVTQANGAATAAGSIVRRADEEIVVEHQSTGRRLYFRKVNTA